MELKFFSIDEVKEFVKQLKGTRGGKSGDGDDEKAATGQTAPQPLAPPAGGAAAFNPNTAVTFAHPVGGATAPGAGPFAQGAAGPAPEVLALVTRINTRIDGAIASGQPADQALSWFRGQVGPEAANFTMDQIKTVALPKLSVAQLEGIAKLMNA